MASIRYSLTADQVAEMHGVSASLIRKMVARGELARVPNLGNRVRIPLRRDRRQVWRPPSHVLEALGIAETPAPPTTQTPTQRPSLTRIPRCGTV